MGTDPGRRIVNYAPPKALPASKLLVTNLGGKNPLTPGVNPVGHR